MKNAKPLKTRDVCEALNCGYDAAVSLFERGLIEAWYLDPTAKRREWRVEPESLAQYIADAKAASTPQPKRRHRRRVTPGRTQYIA
ncbi:hypothetical protein [Algisphaera agarilytica]|uniref:Uncharacterized protein n=1 Tax=Algisphaera agarilytica TaxID=1385975 RepID=A0A7X0LML0_9BACT|nr:hypothetical protein [Algisphaera agarilytica]MBB6431133.1 hypothetical protein [Algisphaera agarilytica]